MAKKVVITGVSRGIGKATAEKFLNEEWIVLGTSTSGKAPFNNSNLTIFNLDISNPLSIERFAMTLFNSNERIDVLINNAGISIDPDIGNLKRETLIKTLDVNLIGLIDLTERLISQINKGGHIVNISSGLGSVNDNYGPYYPAYRISKVGVNMYTRYLAGRLKNYDIIASCIDPGWVQTDMGGAGAPRRPSEAAKDIFQLAVSKVDSGFFWSHGRKRAW